MKHHLGAAVWIITAASMILVCISLRVDLATLWVCSLAWLGGIVSTWAVQSEIENHQRRKAVVSNP